MNIEKQAIFFGLDELEFSIENFKDDILFNFSETLDDDNSSHAYLQLQDFNISFKYSKIYPKGYEYGLKFETIVENQIIDCFAILKGREGQIMSSKNKVVLYSSFFVLEYLGKIDFTLFQFLGLFVSPQLHRFDVALDVPYDIETINKKYFNDVNFFAQIGRDKKNENFSQTYYINNPRSDRNRKYIFRIYDKILDTVKKQKSFLYPHLVNHNDVRRIELEMRPEECKKIPYSVYDILGENRNDIIKKVFSHYFNKHSKKEIKAEKIYLQTQTNNISFNDVSLLFGQLPEDYRKRAIGYIKNIQLNTGYTGLFKSILDFNHFDDFDRLELLKLLENLLIFAKDHKVNKGLLRKTIHKVL